MRGCPPRAALAVRTPGWGIEMKQWSRGYLAKRCRPDGAGSANPNLGFPHRAGRYRPRRPPFLSQVC